MDLDTKITNACHRIEELYYETDGKCYVSFSGGKDSTVLLALIKMCEDIYTIPVGGIPAVFSNTGIELGVTVDFVRWVKNSGWYSNVQMIRPEVSFDWVLKNNGKPMRSKLKSENLHRWKTCRTEAVSSILINGKTINGKIFNRGRVADRDMHMLHDEFPIMPSPNCCTYLKKKPFAKYEKSEGIRGAIVGIRMGEGGIRETRTVQRVRNGGKLCTYTKHDVIYKAPIIDWTDADADAFIQEYHVPLSDAYTKYGFYRTGCMACPFARSVGNDLKYLYYHEPNRYKASMHWLKDVYIAQNVQLPFDKPYEREREREWRLRYEPMRQEMLRKYRPNSRRIKGGDQLNIFELLEDEDE